MAVVVESNVYLLHIHHSTTTENAHNENSMSCSSKPFDVFICKKTKIAVYGYFYLSYLLYIDRKSVV